MEIEESVGRPSSADPVKVTGSLALTLKFAVTVLLPSIVTEQVPEQAPGQRARA